MKKLSYIFSMFPNILFLHVLYVIVCIAVISLSVLVSRYYDAGTGFVVACGIGILMMFAFPLLANYTAPIGHKLWSKIAADISFERGGGYAVLLGIAAVIFIIVVSGYASEWWAVKSAKRLADVRLSEAIHYREQNVMLGLRDAKLPDSRTYGAYKDRVCNDKGKSCKDIWLYVTELTSNESISSCVFLGISSKKNFMRFPPGFKVSPFYYELGILTSTPSEWGNAVANWDTQNRCKSYMIVESIDNPAHLVSEKWTTAWLLTAVFTFVPLIVFIIWSLWTLISDMREKTKAS